MLGGSSSARSTRSRRLSRSGLPAGRKASYGLVAPEQLEALEEPGRDPRAGNGDPDRLKRLPRLQAVLLRKLPEGGLDRIGRPRLDAGKRGGGVPQKRRAAVELGRVRADLAEEETGEGRELPQRRDLLLHERRGPTHERLVPAESARSHEIDQRLRVLLGSHGAEIVAVEVGQFGVVEDGRARADALEREAVD